MAIVAALAMVAALPVGALAKRAPSRLHAFASCPEIVGYAQRHFAQTQGAPGRGVEPLAEPAIPARTPTDTSAPSAPSAGKEAAPTFSTTNVQEEGVDEPDIVKTDGATIFTVVGQTLYAVAATGPGAPRIVGSLALSRAGGDLLLHGRRLLVIQTASPLPVEPVGRRRPPQDRGGPEPDAHHRGRRRRPGRPEGRAHADPRRPVRQRAPERRDRPRRALLDPAGLRGGRRAPPRVGLAPALALRLADLRAPSHAEDRRVPRGAPAAVVLGARDGLDPHHRPGQGSVGGRRRRRHDRRADGLRLGRPPVRGHPALGRSPDAARRAADDLDAHPSLRRQRSRSHHLRGQWRGPGLPAQPVLALRAGRRPARGLDQPSPVWWQGAQQSRQPELRDRPAPRRARRSPPSGGSPGWARASASTRCASSATSATS